jgi:nucleoid DNA-binding protein
LVIAVAERLGYTQNEVSNVVQMTLDAITGCLAEGQRLEIRNFGVFEIKKRDARIGRNPRTGQEVSITEKRVATFKPGKALKEYVEGTGPKPELTETEIPSPAPHAIPPKVKTPAIEGGI